MGLSFQNLDAPTRSKMLEEVNLDVEDASLYVSNNLNEIGVVRWPGLLLDACKTGTDETLALALRQLGCLKTHVQKKKPKGGYTTAAVAVTAAETLSEGQFNLYYIRAICLRASEEGKQAFVYRAKSVEIERESSRLLIGKPLDLDYALKALRTTKGVNPPIDIPLPNSGLSVRLV